MANSYLCTYDLYGPVRNAFNSVSIHYKGKWEGIGPWKSRVFWALLNDIEAIGGCHLGPKELRSQPPPLAQVMDAARIKSITHRDV